MGRSLFKKVYHILMAKYSIFCLPSQSRRYAWVGAGLARPASPLAFPQEMHNVQGLHYSLFIHHYSLFCPCQGQPDDLLRPGDAQAGGALGHSGPAGDHVVHQDHLFPREVDPLPRSISSRHVGLSGG